MADELGKERVPKRKRFRTSRVFALGGNLPSDGFHRAVRPLLVVGRALSLLPVQGVLADDASALRFRWCSFGVLYALAILTGCGFLLWASVKKIVLHGWKLEDSSVVLFSLSALFLVLFLDVARRWPRLAREWQHLEETTARYGQPAALAVKVKVFTVIVVIACSVEHLLAHTKTAIVAGQCTDGSASQWAAYYFQAKYPHIFDDVPYTAWTGALVGLLNFIAMYVWNYNDMFIIVVSMALADRFKMLTARFRQVHGKAMSEDFWRHVREDYNSLSWLCLSVDKALSKLILLSFTSNIYFICLQLYNSIRPMNHAADVVYSYYSFCFLLLRSVLVAHSAAAVNDHSLAPKSVLFSVPSGTFSVEVQRFLLQVTFDDVVLTGMNYFSVTRSLILTVAGTIVTYEIFLIQFHNFSAGSLQENHGILPCGSLHRNISTRG